MRFQSSQRQVFVSAYPMRPYSAAGYGASSTSRNAENRGGDWWDTLTGAASGAAEVVATGWKGSGESGYYSDRGGYGWYYNADNGSIDMVFAPGGGVRVTFYKDDPKWQGIYNAVVEGKQPATKTTVGQIAKGYGGKETSGKAVSSTSAAGAPTAGRVPTKAGGGAVSDRKTSGGAFDTLKDLPNKSWFLPALGVVAVGGVLAIAFWPAKK